jgi:hypothetical protein
MRSMVEGFVGSSEPGRFPLHHPSGAPSPYG